MLKSLEDKSCATLYLVQTASQLAIYLHNQEFLDKLHPTQGLGANCLTFGDLSTCSGTLALIPLMKGHTTLTKSQPRSKQYGDKEMTKFFIKIPLILEIDYNIL